MLRRSAISTGLIGLLMLSGCGGSGGNASTGVPTTSVAPPPAAVTPPQSAWTKSSSHSSFDGDISAVKREFVSTDKSSLIRAMLSCATTKKSMTLTLESYSRDGSPSPFVSTTMRSGSKVVKLVQGRIKFGAQEPEEPSNILARQI